MILIINICKEEMHYLEFVKPIEDILKSIEEPFITKKYNDVSKKDLDSCHRIIITGTSLKDMSYSKYLSKFKFITDYENKPLLAICGGMQILCMLNGCKLSTGKTIGMNKIDFNATFLGLNGSREVYELHNMMIPLNFELFKNFNIYSKTRINDVECAQAIKHKHHKQYAVLFHPEVRNKDLIKNFLTS